MTVDARAIMTEVLAARGVPDADQIANALYLELAMKSAIGDAGYLRWCEWPDCLRSYHVLSGPDPERDGRGWIYVRNGDSILLCPDHADAGHRPSRSEWQSGWEHINAVCECGARGDHLAPASLGRANQWWREHVLTAGADS